MGIANLLWPSYKISIWNFYEALKSLGLILVVILIAWIILYGEKLTNYDIIGLGLILSGTRFILYEENFD